MRNVGLLVCGNSGIDYEKVDFPYEIIRSKLIIEGKEYEDFIDITAHEFYDVLNENPDVQLSTAMASTGEVIEKLELLKSQGYKEVIAVVISSALSGTFQNFMLAKDAVEGLDVYVVDSHYVSFGQLILLNEANKMIVEGKPAKEIYDYLMDYRKRIRFYVLVDTLKYLVKNGRLSAASGLIGALLKIKPLLHINDSGELVLFERIRTSSRARKRFIELAKEEIDKGVIALYLGYTDNLEFVKGIKLELLEYKNDLPITLHPLTPVVGAHAGPGTCGFGVVYEEEQ